MTYTMTPSERRRAYELKRIVVSQHNHLALKRLGQAGDSFNDVISNLLRIQRNHQQEKGEKKREEQQQQQQQQKSSYDDDSSINNVINDLYPSTFFDEALGHHRKQMDEIFRTIKEKQEQEKRQQDQSSNK